MTITYSSLIDNINVHYMENLIDKKIARKMYNTLEKYLIYNTDEESEITIRGKKIKIPRKQVAYGTDGTFYRFTGIKVQARNWNDLNDPVCLVIKKILEKVELATGKSFNFVLINRYKDGNEYIGYHSDDYRDLNDIHDIVGVSLGASRDFLLKSKKFIPEKVDEIISINLKSGSLVSMKHPTNLFWKHAVPKRASVKTPRISLTFRNIVIDQN